MAHDLTDVGLVGIYLPSPLFPLAKGAIKANATARTARLSREKRRQMDLSAPRSLLYIERNLKLEMGVVSRSFEVETTSSIFHLRHVFSLFRTSVLSVAQ